MIMKRIVFISILFLAAQVAFSQVVVLNYMKVPPGGGKRYVMLEEQILKVKQEAVNRGMMIGGELYRVYSQGSESAYQYVTADIYSDLSSSLKPADWEMVREVLGADADQILDDVFDSRELIYRETIGFSMGFFAEEDENILIVSYMKADDPQKHFTMEKTAYMPFHELRRDKGYLVSWNVWRPYLFDERSDYTSIIANGYSSIDQISESNMKELYEEFIEDKSEEEVAELEKWYDNVGKIRTIVRTQVWEKVLATEPAEE
jgi:hypothetical protein